MKAQLCILCLLITVAQSDGLLTTVAQSDGLLTTVAEPIDFLFNCESNKKKKSFFRLTLEPSKKQLNFKCSKDCLACDAPTDPEVITKEQSEYYGEKAKIIMDLCRIRSTIFCENFFQENFVEEIARQRQLLESPEKQENDINITKNTEDHRANIINYRNALKFFITARSKIRVNNLYFI